MFTLAHRPSSLSTWVLRQFEWVVCGVCITYEYEFTDIYSLAKTLKPIAWVLRQFEWVVCGVCVTYEHTLTDIYSLAKTLRPVTWVPGQFDFVHGQYEFCIWDTHHVWCVSHMHYSETCNLGAQSIWLGVWAMWMGRVWMYGVSYAWQCEWVMSGACHIYGVCPIQSCVVSGAFCIWQCESWVVRVTYMVCVAMWVMSGTGSSREVETGK